MAADSGAPAARVLRRGRRMVPIRHSLLTERHDEGDLTWCSGMVGADTHWLVADHRIAGVPVLPGTAYLEAARCAFEECHPPPGRGHVVELRDVVFSQPLAVPDGSAAEVRVVLTPGADGTDFEVISNLNETTRAHARGSAAWIAAAREHAPVLSAIQQRCSAGVREGYIQAISRSGLITFGSHWGNLVRVHDGAGEELALLALKEDVGLDPYPWTIQPALLDEALASGWPDTTEAFLPLGYGRVVIRRRLPARLWSHLRYRDSGAADMLAADATLYDEAGDELLHVEDFYMRKADGAIAPQVVVAADGPQPGLMSPGGLAGSPTEREAAVTELFASQLENHAIGRTDNFFDLGGDSLLASEIIAIVHARLGVQIPLRRFFADPTVAGIAALIGELCATPNATGAGTR